MRIAILALAVGFIATTIDVAAGPPKRRTHTVKMAGMQFVPKVLTVARGDTIVWVNDDVVSHTATSAAAGFDSKAVDPEKRWKLTVQTKRGEFPYVCKYHPLMTGTLRVQ
jgi:plastocyanin